MSIETPLCFFWMRKTRAKGFRDLGLGLSEAFIFGSNLMIKSRTMSLSHVGLFFFICCRYRWQSKSFTYCTQQCMWKRTSTIIRGFGFFRFGVCLWTFHICIYSIYWMRYWNLWIMTSIFDYFFFVCIQIFVCKPFLLCTTALIMFKCYIKSTFYRQVTWAQQPR